MASNWPQVLIKTDVRFGSKADMCSATRMSALHLIATVKADIALQDAFLKATPGICVGDALAIAEQADV